MFFGAKPLEGLSVGARHRMPESLEQRPSRTDPGQRRRLSGAVCDVASASLLCVACLTALVLNGTHSEKRTVAANLGPPTISRPVTQEGTVIAATERSVTTRGADGRIQTYLVTPNTTVIIHGGHRPYTAAPHFTVNDRVIVVGTIEGDTALATAVADRGAGHGDVPPMDYLGDQAFPSGSS